MSNQSNSEFWQWYAGREHGEPESPVHLATLKKEPELLRQVAEERSLHAMLELARQPQTAVDAFIGRCVTASQTVLGTAEEWVDIPRNQSGKETISTSDSVTTFPALDLKSKSAAKRRRELAWLAVAVAVPFTLLGLGAGWLLSNYQQNQRQAEVAPGAEKRPAVTNDGLVESRPDGSKDRDNPREREPEGLPTPAPLPPQDQLVETPPAQDSDPPRQPFVPGDNRVVEAPPKSNEGNETAVFAGSQSTDIGAIGCRNGVRQ